MSRPLKTVLIGFGNIAEGFSHDTLYSKYWKYPTHASVLKDHHGFYWDAVVDTSKRALEKAKNHWDIPITVESVQELPDHYLPEVAIIATPPQVRKEIIEYFPSLKAVIVEKPLGVNIEDAINFTKFCNKRGIIVQVNLWRRGDRIYQKLAKSQFSELVGEPQSVFSNYGNGLKNNGVHLIDLIRFLMGEIKSVQSIPGYKLIKVGPLDDDFNIPAVLSMESGVPVALFPISFNNYREISLEVWGTKGLLSCLIEGLSNTVYPIADNRCLIGEKEININKPISLGSGASDAIYVIYDNLYEAVFNNKDLLSPIDNAVKSELVVEKIISSAQNNGAVNLIKNGKY
jgi:predicted dehydrogenase